MGGRTEGTDWRWFLLGAAWVYGIGVNIFATLPALTEWYCGNDADPTKWYAGVTLTAPETFAWLYWIAVLGHAVLFIGNMVASPRAMFGWHHGVSLFAYAWAAIAVLVWIHVEGFDPSGAPTFDLTKEESVRGYILWKVALVLGFVASITSTASSVDLIRSHFKHRKYHPRT